MERLRMCHKDGYLLTFEANGSPVYGEKGHFCRFQGVWLDITSRMAASADTIISR